MAEPEHVRILRKGVQAWNLWRNSHPDMRPDLRGANLTEADLNGANLISVEHQL